jgi:hypothetical protein
MAEDLEQDAAADQQAATISTEDAEPTTEGDIEAESTVEDETTAVEDDPSEITDEEFEQLRENEVAYRWEASEYVHNNKSGLWYLGLVGLLIVLIGLAALLHYWLEIVAFLVMGAAIVVYARRPPRVLTYELGPTGITVDGKELPFSQFTSFGVLADIDWHTIDLEPVQRFAARLSIIFDPEDFDAVVGHLELHLPRVDRDPDVIERVARLIRF